MTYVMIGLCRSGKCLQTMFACAKFRFCPSGSFFPCADVFMQGLLRKSCTPGLPFFSLPSFRRAGWGRAASGCPCFASRGPSSPPVQREGWRSLWSLVRCMRARFCLFGSFVDWGCMSCSLAVDSCYPICPGWFSLLIPARPAR